MSKRNSKALAKGLGEEKQILKQEVSLFNQLANMIKSERIGMSPQQMKIIAKHLKNKSQSSIDIGYIRTVLFPELYSYDIPQPLSNISFSRFTDKQEATVNTGNDGFNGAGLILWFPKVNYGPSIFYYASTAADLDKSLPIPFVKKKGTTTGTTNYLDSTKWKVGFIQ